MIPPAPGDFDGSLSELFTRHMQPVLLPVEVVRAFHQVLVEYCAGPDPLFIVRCVAGLERGPELRTEGGRFRPSDSSPAWWVHHRLFTRVGIENVSEMAALMAAIPCHMHDLTRARLRTVSSAGWHVAHILNAKDGNVNYAGWSRDELTRRFVRNLHPCNCFYVPKAEWPRYGGDRNVLRFAAQVYRDRYGPVWQEFLRLAGGRDLPPPSIAPQEFRYVYERPVRTAIERQSDASRGLKPARSVPGTANAPDIVEYHSTRLMFIRSKIDPLPPEGVFSVVTRDHGTFQFTRAAFERVFANVLKTASWQEQGLYHMSRPPRKALPFRIAPPGMEG